MKWSLITGWLQRKNQLGLLAGVEVSHDHVFDVWLREQADLRYRHAVPFMARDAWPAGTECLEILRSRPYFLAGHSGFTSGGVTLVGADALPTTRLVNDAVVSARRAGLDPLKSDSNRLVSSVGAANAGVDVSLPVGSAAAAKVAIDLPETVRMRTGNIGLARGEITLDIRVDGAARAVSLETPAGRLGVFEAAATKNGVALKWTGADVAHRRRMVDKITGEAGVLDADLRAARPGNYVIESGDRQLLVELGAESGASKASIYHTADATAELPSDTVLESAAQGTARLFGDRDPGRKVGVTVVERQHALDRLEKTTVQRLEVERADGSDVITRTFATTTRSGGTPVYIETGHPVLGRIEGRVHDDGVDLVRPTGATRAFDDLVTRHALTPQDVERLVAQHRAGQPIETVNLSTRGGRSTAGRPPNGPDAPSSAAGQRLAEGGGDAAGAFKRGMNDPAAQLEAIVASIERGDTADGAARLRTLITDTHDVEKLAALQPALRGRPGEKLIAEAIDARQGHADLAPDVARKIQIKGDRSPRVALDLDDGLHHSIRRFEPAAHDDLLETIERGESPVYLDQRLLREFDFDTAPGESIRKVFDRPGLVAVRARVGGLGGFRPGEVGLPGGQSVRRVRATKEPRPLPWRGAALAGAVLAHRGKVPCDPALGADCAPDGEDGAGADDVGAPTSTDGDLLILIDCDQDDDGEVSESEQRGCLPDAA